MAIYYMNVQIIGRSAGRTATGAAAYRAGERIVDERTGQAFDYTRRRGEIETEILAPEGAPAWVQDRSRLWNEVERGERRGDAQVAREIVVAFPIELTKEQQRELIREYVREEFVARGMAADVAIHRNPGNPHAHIMLTLREVGPDGFSSKKNREWNKPDMLERWRAEWASRANHALERAGREERIDHRSLAEQGLERLPQVHLGPHASALERQGVATEKGDHNRLVAEHNAVVIDLDRARQEREALRAQKIAQDRQGSLRQRGWSQESAEALTGLEKVAKKPLTRTDVASYRSQVHEELRTIVTEINHVREVEDGLTRATDALTRYQEAQAEMDRLRSPLKAIQRLFSPEARQQYQNVEHRLKWTAENTERWGVRSEPELRQRQADVEQQRSRLPALKDRQADLERTLDHVERALQGFAREADRQRQAQERTLAREWDRVCGHSRSPDSGRGR